MAKSSLVKLQIEKHYDGCYIEIGKLISHLKSNKVDRTIDTQEKHSGFDACSDFANFYYSDGSVLIISAGCVQSLRK